jgi:hypothetical protein
MIFRFSVDPFRANGALSAVFALSICLGACASKGVNPVAKTNSGKMFAVAVDKTSFYRYGPQQGNGEDKSLPKDTLMTLIRPSFGYCKVHLAAGEEGYVASEDIKPAPATLLAALNPPERTPASSHENFDVQSSEPPPPETLPDPDLPPAVTEPLP